MAATENTLPDAGQIDIHAFRPDVNEKDFKSEVSRSSHHFEVVSARKRSLDREALSPIQALFGK